MIPYSLNNGKRNKIFSVLARKEVKGNQRKRSASCGPTYRPYIVSKDHIFTKKKMESNTSQDNIVDTYKNWVYLIIPLGSSIKNAIMPNYEVESGNTRSYDDRQSHTNNGIQWHSQLHPYGRRQHTSWLNHPCASTVASAFLQCDHRIGACQPSQKRASYSQWWTATTQLSCQSSHQHASSPQLTGQS